MQVFAPHWRALITHLLEKIRSVQTNARGSRVHVCVTHTCCEVLHAEASAALGAAPVVGHLRFEYAVWFDAACAGAFSASAMYCYNNCKDTGGRR